MLKNTILIFLAFLTACVFWLATVSSQQNIKTLENPIPVKYFNIPEGLSVSKDIPEIAVTIDSFTDKNPQIGISNFQAFIDLSEATEGTRVLPIQVKSQNSDIRIVSFTPSETEVQLEPIESNSFDIGLELTGSISENYEIVNEILSRKRATVKAGETLLSTINKVKAIIELNGEERDIERTIKLKAFDTNGTAITNVQIEPEDIQVALQLDQISDTKIVGIKPIFKNSLAEGLTISSVTFEPNITEVQAKKFILSTIKEVQTESIDLSEITESITIIKKIIPPINTEIVGEKEVEIIIEVNSIL